MTPNRSAFAEQEMKGPVMHLHPPVLLAHMLDAADAAADSPDWPRVQGFARVELRRLAEFFALLEKRRWEEQMDEDEARLWAALALHQARATLAEREPLGLCSAPQLVDAAVAAVRGQVNRAVTFEVV